jgi:hypothetical protein
MGEEVNLAYTSIQEKDWDVIFKKVLKGEITSMNTK